MHKHRDFWRAKRPMVGTESILDEDDERDALSPARGILIGLIFSFAIWVGLWWVLS